MQVIKAMKSTDWTDGLERNDEKWRDFIKEFECKEFRFYTTKQLTTRCYKAVYNNIKIKTVQNNALHNIQLNKRFLGAKI